MFHASTRFTVSIALLCLFSGSMAAAAGTGNVGSGSLQTTDLTQKLESLTCLGYKAVELGADVDQSIRSADGRSLKAESFMVHKQGGAKQLFFTQDMTVDAVVMDESAITVNSTTANGLKSKLSIPLADGKATLSINMDGQDEPVMTGLVCSAKFTPSNK